MTSKHKLTRPPATTHNLELRSTAVLEKGEAQANQNRRFEATQLASESRIGVPMQKGAENFNAAGQRYRFEHLALPMVLKGLYFSKNDPGPGDRAPKFDLLTVDRGHFRSSDLAETGPALLIFGSSTCPVTDNAAPGLNELYHRFTCRS